MRKLCIETRGGGDWRTRLADPSKQWKRQYSALETAVAWESADDSSHGIPAPIYEVLKSAGLADPKLLLGIAEHKVPLEGTGPDSQCDVWALIGTKVGTLSLSIEAKANEGFGQGGETLQEWLDSDTEASRCNRLKRWQYISHNLPLPLPDSINAYERIPYQLLHRCATSVIEAKRFGLTHAIFLVQAFQSPAQSYGFFEGLCSAMGLSAKRNGIAYSTVDEVKLGVGWVDCKMTSDKQVAAVI